MKEYFEAFQELARKLGYTISAHTSGYSHRNKDGESITLIGAKQDRISVKFTSAKGYNSHVKHYNLKGEEVK